MFRTVLFNLFIAAFILASCKVQKPVATTPAPIAADTVQVAKEAPAREVQDSVEIGAHRVFPDTISIIGVGDMMLGTNFPEPRYLPLDTGRSLLNGVAGILSSADLAFGNLEGVILDEGGTPKNCRNPKRCYAFRMPEVVSQHLASAGFDVLSVANNHSGDFGEEGREGTATALGKVGIEFAGFQSHPYTIFKKGEIVYGFAAFSPNKGTMLLHDLDTAQSIVQMLDSQCDIVIVSFHGGAEGKEHQNVTRETEFFHGEDRGNVYAFSHAMVDAGADVIFGHGPHVVRAVEIYQQRLIAYSLGNFCTYARFNLQGENGLAPLIQANVDHKGRFIDGHIYSAIQSGLGIPVMDNQHRAVRKIEQLTQKDFPEGVISFADSGRITIFKTDF